MSAPACAMLAVAALYLAFAGPARAQDDAPPPSLLEQVASSEEGDWYLDRSLEGFRAYPYLQRAQRHISAAQWDEAERMLELAEERHPASAALPVIRARLEIARGHHGTAFTHLAEALARDPTLAQAYLFRAVARRALGDPAGAELDLALALESGDLTTDQTSLAERERSILAGDVVPEVNRAAQTAPVNPAPAPAVEQRRAPANPNRVAQAAPRPQPVPQRAPYVPRQPLPADEALGNLGYSFARDDQCYPADPLFELAYRHSQEARFLIARADCFNAAGDGPQALAYFQEALALGPALSTDERTYVTQSIANLTTVEPSPLQQAATDANYERAQAAEEEMAHAYELVRQGRDGEAARHFERALQDPDGQRFRAREDLAYAHLRLRNYDEAAANFRGVVDNQDRYDQSTPEAQVATEERIYRVRRETEMIERNSYGFVSAVLRTSDINTSGVTQSDRVQSQLGAEYGFFPFRGQRNVLHNVGVYGRLFQSLEPDSFELRDESLQAGIGLRLKPFTFTDLVLRGERMIAIGDDARDAWLVSAAHSWGVGGDWRPTEESWPYVSTYVEGAWIVDTPEFVSAVGEVVAGRAYAIADNLAVIPHAVGSMRYSGDEFAENTLGEAGLGIGLRYWYDETNYVAPRGTVDLQFQYRWYVYEDTELALGDDGAFVGRLVISR